MTAISFTNVLAEALIGWMAAIALSVVGYLFWLEIRELRRNRRMDAERVRLGLRRV